MKNFIILLGLLLTLKNSVENVFGYSAYEKCVYTTMMEVVGSIKPEYYDCVSQYGESNCSINDYINMNGFTTIKRENAIGHDELCNRDGDDSYYIGYCPEFGFGKFDLELTEKNGVPQDFTEGCGYIEANDYEPEYLCIKKKEGECSSLDDHYIYVNNQWQLYDTVITESATTIEPTTTAEPAIIIESTTTTKSTTTVEPTTTAEPITTTKPTITAIIPNGKRRCGKGIGSCKNNECCSKYGWCGKTDKYCKVEEGCQSEFGKCELKSVKITAIVTKIKTVTQRPSLRTSFRRIKFQK